MFGSFRDNQPAPSFSDDIGRSSFNEVGTLDPDNSDATE